MSGKTCWACKEFKDLEAFHCDASKGDGRASICKLCKKVRYPNSRTTGDPDRIQARERARRRAFIRLREHYPERFETIFAEEMAAEGYELTRTAVSDQLVDHHTPSTTFRRA